MRRFDEIIIAERDGASQDALGSNNIYTPGFAPAPACKFANQKFSLLSPANS